MHSHWIETRIRYLTTQEGGRKSGVANGYRGQFYYDGEDCDGVQYFPDFAPDEIICLGHEFRVIVRFPQDRWDLFHQHRLCPGKPFQIREGSHVVGEGVVTHLDVPFEMRDQFSDWVR
jgi:translation elongation factor EF-Tu-like GTPase